jgi:mxaJ protein
MLYGDYSKPDPQRAIVDAVAQGDIDVAVVWGPIAGYFADAGDVPLNIRPVQTWLDGPRWPMVFDISMGVRKDDRALMNELDDSLERHRTEINALLSCFEVPRAP